MRYVNLVLISQTRYAAGGYLADVRVTIRPSVKSRRVLMAPIVGRACDFRGEMELRTATGCNSGALLGASSPTQLPSSSL